MGIEGASAGIEGDKAAAGSLRILPGYYIGGVRIGATYEQVAKAYPSLDAGRGFAHMVIATIPGVAEVVFASPDPNKAISGAIVVAASTVADGAYWGPVVPGKTRASIETYWGAPTDIVNATAYYRSGVSVVYDAPDSGTALASRVAVYQSYKVETKAPAMQHSRGPYVNKPSMVDTSKVSFVDAHLHSGKAGRMPRASREFLKSHLPPFIQLYADALLNQIPVAYAPYLGIQGQSRFAGASHVVLLATYVQNTTGFETNEDLERTLTDARNVNADGQPWAWGMASINWFDGYVDASGKVNQNIAASRLKALSSYFERRRDLFIAIKLAHAHQGVAFDDQRYMGVYEVASAKGVPVYLHTGFSPFPGSMRDSRYYDPAYLEGVIQRYPSVKFILGHMGQGDARAMEHALSLAERYENVYLEISALEGPFYRDERGLDIRPDFSKPQYPYALAQIKERGLIAKTYFGTDGPQSAGFIAGYTAKVRAAMASCGYTDEESKRVMADNFFDIYFPDSHF
jgi:hypothetical protein